MQVHVGKPLRRSSICPNGTENMPVLEIGIQGSPSLRVRLRRALPSFGLTTASPPRSAFFPGPSTRWLTGSKVSERAIDPAIDRQASRQAGGGTQCDTMRQ